MAIVELLNWSLFPNMVRFETIGDGNCFFHCILLAVCREYKNACVVTKRAFAAALRKKLADILPEKYSQLSNGKLKDFSDGFPEYTLENMITLLKSNLPVDNIFNELVSDLLDIDIYLLSNNLKSLYVTGSEENFLYKCRKSVVILVLPGHYELVGVYTTETTAKTLFDYSHPFILKLDSLRTKTI